MLKQILCSATLLCVTGLSSAAVIVQDFTIERTKTDFQETINFDLFDDDMGNRILESVEFILTARTSAVAKVENTASDPSDIYAELNTNITVIGSLSSLMLSASPSIVHTETLDPFDGEDDFAGDSGKEIFVLAADVFDDISYFDEATLMAYTGLGQSSVDFSATANSIFIGGGNVTSSFSTAASGDLQIIYTYSELTRSVSEPAQVALLGLGLVGMFGFRKTKK